MFASMKIATEQPVPQNSQSANTTSYLLLFSEASDIIFGTRTWGRCALVWHQETFSVWNICNESCVRETSLLEHYKPEAMWYDMQTVPGNCLGLRLLMTARAVTKQHQ